MEHVVSTALLLTWQKLLLLLMLLTSCSAQSTYYVTPTPDTPCPGEPCHTLSEYVAGQFFNNLPVNTTMEFLPGNHTLEQTISVTNLKWFTLHGDSSSLPEVTSRIECTWPAGFVFTNITELHISVLAFISCGHDISPAVTITSVWQSDISDCIFQNSSNGNNNPYDYYIYDYNSTYDYYTYDYNSTYDYYYLQGGALFVEDGTFNFTGNTFQYNSADFGGALYVEDGTVNFTGNTFQYNSAVRGGALCVWDGTFNFTGNTFQYNSADVVGGALYVWDGIFNFTGNTFQNNSADGDGGALGVLDGTLNFTGNTFQNNTAGSSGGALYVSGGIPHFIGNTFQKSHAALGGSLHMLSSNVTFTGDSFTDSYAQLGGAILATDNSVVNMYNITIGNNRAEYMVEVWLQWIVNWKCQKTHSLRATEPAMVEDCMYTTQNLMEVHCLIKILQLKEEEGFMHLGALSI